MTHRVFFWPAIVLACLLARPADAAEPFRPAPRQLGATAADQAEGRQALEDFRRAGVRGTYWFQFELRVMPRQGDERTVRGQLYGTRGPDGPLLRLAVDATGLRQPTHRWLIRSGPTPAAWTWTAASGEVAAVAVGDQLKPIAETDLTLFDLQLPFLYWTDFAYEGVGKVRGRPVHRFLLYPPPDVAAARPDLTGVRVALDTQFGAMTEAEYLGPKGEPLRTITVLDVKKLGDQWLVKSIDLRNHVTKAKTRFSVNAAALDLEAPSTLFQPDGLREDPAGLVDGSAQRL